jgi:hypothetical protein
LAGFSTVLAKSTDRTWPRMRFSWLHFRSFIYFSI